MPIYPRTDGGLVITNYRGRHVSVSRTDGTIFVGPKPGPGEPPKFPQPSKKR